jgi:hypothetical protein
MKTLPRRAPSISQSTQSNVYEDFIFVILCAHFVVFVVKSKLKIMNSVWLNLNFAWFNRSNVEYRNLIFSKWKNQNLQRTF